MNKQTRLRLVCCSIVLSILLLPSAAQAAVGHGRFLLSAAKSGIVDTYGGAGGAGAPIEFNQAVRDTPKDIDAGEIRFTYDTYVRAFRPAGAATRTGGAAMAGGFFMAAGVRVKPGFHLNWVQTIGPTTTINGANGWGFAPLGDDGEFPDTNPPNKKYPFLSVPFGPAPTLAIQDFPGRSVPTPQSWSAELGLVCIADTADANGFREVRVIGTVLWGFEIANNLPATAGIEDVVADGKGFWGPPTASYLDTLNEFFDGLGGAAPGVATNKYNFVANDNCFLELAGCGNATCEPSQGETPCTCPVDCPGECPTCGDGECQTGENSCDCFGDCFGECPGCGDGVCAPNEDGCSCPFDCFGGCTFCGDGGCDPNEDEGSCPLDCLVGGASTPTVSEWAAIVMTLLLLTAGTVVFGRQRRPASR